MPFLKHYLKPLFVKAKPYDASRFFDSYYSDTEFSDGTTVSPSYFSPAVEFHYRATELSIIESLFPFWSQIQNIDMLDVGSGAGHWVDFYRKVFGTTRIVASDISRVCCEKLRSKYKNLPIWNKSLTDMSPIESFDFINAIGVMFHIVDDKQWEWSIQRVSELLSIDGFFLVGGHFGWITANVQFHNSDDFGEWNNNKGYKFYNKRIRSLRKWKQTTRKYGLEFVSLIKSPKSSGLRTPENNIALFRRI